MRREIQAIESSPHPTNHSKTFKKINAHGFSGPTGYANAYFGLLEELEQLFGRSVDLIVDSAIRNPYFRQSIQRKKALLYGA
jgi:hypothetical protein